MIASSARRARHQRPVGLNNDHVPISVVGVHNIKLSGIGNYHNVRNLCPSHTPSPTVHVGVMRPSTRTVA